MTTGTHTFHPNWLLPDWQALGVSAVMTTRHGGISQPPFNSLNLRDGVGDEPQAVAHNQAVFRRALGGATPVMLNQVHGAAVVRLLAADAQAGAPIHTADAAITTEPLIACTVQVADCLPVLFAAPQGRAVGAAHAGWRGLTSGVLAATAQAVCHAAACEPAQLQVWLGACIGTQAFEVGADVLQAFGAGPHQAQHFQPKSNGKWLADLPSLARERLHAIGVRHISGGTWCTASAPERFFSYRRDQRTGRMVAAVWVHRG
jgi:polyphenol oxidase